MSGFIGKMVRQLQVQRQPLAMRAGPMQTQFQGSPDPGMPISSFYTPQGGSQGGSLTDMLQAQPQQTGGDADFLKQLMMQRSAANAPRNG